MIHKYLIKITQKYCMNKTRNQITNPSLRNAHLILCFNLKTGNNLQMDRFNNL